jgi:hypothetical protein
MIQLSSERQENQAEGDQKAHQNGFTPLTFTLQPLGMSKPSQ